jgi:hypothetical protein
MPRRAPAARQPNNSGEASANNGASSAYVARRRNMASLAASLSHGIIATKEVLMPENTRKSYFPKIKEWNQYCNSVYLGEEAIEGFVYQINTRKLLPFMLVYQFMRERKPVGGQKAGQGFSVDDYDGVLDQYQDYFAMICTNPQGARAASDVPELKDPLQAQSISQYCAAITRYLVFIVNTRASSSLLLLGKVSGLFHFSSCLTYRKLVYRSTRRRTIRRR